MILSFKQKIKEEATNFPIKIFNGLASNKLISDKDYTSYLDRYLDSFSHLVKLKNKSNIKPKIHTIREDINNRWKPGNDIHFYVGTRTNKALQFAPIVKCKSIQYIRISYGLYFSKIPKIHIDNKELNLDEILTLAINDGFENLEDFLNWFNKDFKGKIIHWTDTKY